MGLASVDNSLAIAYILSVAWSTFRLLWKLAMISFAVCNVLASTVALIPDFISVGMPCRNVMDSGIFLSEAVADFADAHALQDFGRPAYHVLLCHGFHLFPGLQYCDAQEFGVVEVGHQRV